jgi:hypothetical protein
MPDIAYDLLFSDGRPSVGHLASLEDAKMAGYSATKRGGTFKVIEVDRSHAWGTAQTLEVFDSSLPDA